MIWKMGRMDKPEEQEQPLLMLSPRKGNIAVFGSPMSGKTTFVKTLLVRLHENFIPGDEDSYKAEEIYIVDFGGNLGDYSKLGYVCATFDSSSEENIKRIFKTVRSRLAENAETLQNKNYYEFRDALPEAERRKCPPHITFIIENINAFMADNRYDQYRDILMELCRDGQSKGLTVVITGRDTSGVGRLLSNFAQKIGFSLGKDEYTDIFNGRVIPPMRLPGRGIVNQESKNYEFQCYLPFAGKEADDLKALIEKTQWDNPRRMRPFAKELTLANLSAEAGKDTAFLDLKDGICVGLDYYTHKAARLDLSKDRVIGIYGKRQFGKNNLTDILLQGIDALCSESTKYTFVFIDDGRRRLEPIYLKYYKKPGYYSEDGNLNRLFYFDNIKHFFMGNDSCDGITQTVFIVSSKSLYSSNHEMTRYREKFIDLASIAEDNDLLMIFRDVRPLRAQEAEVFNSCMNVAFLLDNIKDFANKRGGRTPFAEVDEDMLKAYASCERGDGFLYRIEEDSLVKLKFMKAEKCGD